MMVHSSTVRLVVAGRVYSKPKNRERRCLLCPSGIRSGSALRDPVRVKPDTAESKFFLVIVNAGSNLVPPDKGAAQQSRTATESLRGLHLPVDVLYQANLRRIPIGEGLS